MTADVTDVTDVTTDTTTDTTTDKTADDAGAGSTSGRPALRVPSGDVPTPGGARPRSAPDAGLDAVVAHLAALLPDGRTGPGPDVVAAGGADLASVRVHGVTLSSQQVLPGDLYAALPGLRAHGADYAAAAAAAGAVAVLTDPAGRDRAAATGLPVLVVDAPRAVLGDLAAWLYGTAGRPPAVLGVTGTNGKTTTTFLLDAALRAAGATTGLVGTIEIRSADRRLRATGTTPEAPALHALLAVMHEDGVTTCAMEVSSHALAQHRVDGLVVDVAGFTNLSQDHLDYHRTMEEYFAAKALLLTPAHARRGVVVVDDAWGRRMAAGSQVPVVTVTTRPDVDADWTVVGRTLDAGLVTAHVTGPDGADLHVRCPLPGDFNVANTLLALVMLVEAGHEPAAAAAALGAAGPVPGRMEKVPGTGTPGEPVVVVDYAHTPDAVAAALDALRDAGHPLVVVLGAGGDRDRDKRPLMGAAAARAADVVVVTDDNPRSEEPAAIRAALLAGARDAVAGAGHDVEVLEVDRRRAAIAEGVARAWGGGVLLVAGKGHEQGQDVAGVVHPFDDRAVAREVLLAASLAPGAATAPAAGRTGA